MALLKLCPSASQSADADVAVVLRDALEADFNVAIAAEVGKLVAPFDEEDVSAAEKVVEPQGFEFPLGIDAVQVDVEQVDGWSMIFVNEGECGAGDIFLGCRLETFGDALDQRGLARAEISAQHDDLGRLQFARKMATEGNRFLRRVGGVFLGSHSG